MTDEALLSLALQACHDRDSQQVLGDAVLEAGWSDWRVTALLVGPRFWWTRQRWSGDMLMLDRVRSLERAANLSRKHARNPTRRWCRAVAAVLLFGEWTLQRWPVAYRPEAFRTWYEAEWQTQALEAVGVSLFGVNREENPTRLAGLDAWTPAGRFAQSQDRVRLMGDLQAMGAITDEQLRRFLSDELAKIS